MNAAARLVGGLSRFDHVTSVLPDALHWLPIKQRIVYQIAVFAFDCVRGTCPSYLHGVCTPLTEVSGRVGLRSAHRGDLYVPTRRSELGKCSFRVAAPRIWNSLLLHLRSFTISWEQFRARLKTHLFKCGLTLIRNLFWFQNWAGSFFHKRNIRYKRRRKHWPAGRFLFA